MEAEQRVMMVAEGNSTYLECLPRSRHAAVTWYKQAGENSPELNKVKHKSNKSAKCKNANIHWFHLIFPSQGGNR